MAMKLNVTVMIVMFAFAQAEHLRNRQDPFTVVDLCGQVTCRPITCVAPFEFRKDQGTCCPLCVITKPLPTGTDTTGLTGGIGPHAQADLALCKDVMCPELHCSLEESFFKEGSCCARCPGF